MIGFAVWLLLVAVLLGIPTLIAHARGVMALGARPMRRTEYPRTFRVMMTIRAAVVACFLIAAAAAAVATILGWQPPWLLSDSN